MPTIQEMHEVYPNIVQKIKAEDIRTGDILFVFYKNERVPCIVISNETYQGNFCNITTDRGIRLIHVKFTRYVLRI